MCISRNNGIARPLKQEQRKSTQMKDSILYKVTKRELFINKCQHLFLFPKQAIQHLNSNLFMH